MLQGNEKLSDKNKCDQMLTYIAQELFIIPHYFDEIIEFFSEELPKLLNKLVCSKELTETFHNITHLPKCVLLGKVVKLRPDLQE